MFQKGNIVRISSFAFILTCFLGILAALLRGRELGNNGLSSELYVYSSFDLFTVNPATLDLEVLLHWDNGVSDFAWSPSGTMFAVANSSREMSEITIFAPNGEEIQRAQTEADLRFNRVDRPISWNKREDRIYMFLEDNQRSVWVGYADLLENSITAAYPLDVNGGTLSGIFWSPDNTYVLYQSDPSPKSAEDPFTKPYHLHILDLSTGEIRLITAHTQYRCIAWLDDEFFGIVESRWYEEGIRKSSGLTILGIEGEIIETVTPIYQDQEVFGCPFVWSNDRTHIAFYGSFLNERGRGREGVFSFTFESDETQLVAHDSEEVRYWVNSITWSPDDLIIAFEAGYHAFSDIRIASLSGWSRAITLDGMPLLVPEWRNQPIEQEMD